MMKYFLVVTLLIVATSAFPQQQQQAQAQPRNPSADATILRSSNDNEGTGNYHWEYESSDGSKQDQTGELRKNPDPKEPDYQAAQGSFSYITADGKNVLVTYTADEKGYRVKTTYN